MIVAGYTRLKRQEIEAISANFAIDHIRSFKVLSGGSENTNYLIVADGGKYVLSISEQKSEEKARELAQLLEHLEKHHFETSKLIRDTRNEPVFFWKGRPAMMRSYVEGKILKNPGPLLIELAGREIAKLHKIDSPDYLPRQLNYGKEQFGMVGEYAANSPFDIWLKEKLEFVKPCFDLNLPKALIHSDVFCDNVVAGKDGKSLVIIDFEDAVCYYRIFDIGMMIIGLCAEGKTVNLEKAGYILKGYFRENQLLDTELLALQAFTVYAGASMTFWRHQNFNYIKPDPKLANHYLGLKVLTDYVAGKSAKAFLEELKFRQ